MFDYHNIRSASCSSIEKGVSAPVARFSTFAAPGRGVAVLAAVSLFAWSPTVLAEGLRIPG